MSQLSKKSLNDNFIEVVLTSSYIAKDYLELFQLSKTFLNKEAFFNLLKKLKFN